MIKKDDLEEILTNANLVGFETDVKTINLIYLKNNEISEIIKFAKTNSIKSVLYFYSYYDKGDYEITLDDVSEEFGSKFSKIIECDVDRYNQFTSKLDFSRPQELCVYCLLEGCSFAILLEDYWIEEKNILDAHDKLGELLYTYDSAFEQISIENDNNRVALKNSLKEYVLADPNFILCTNEMLRRTYLSKLLKEKPEYTKAFLIGEGSFAFIELVWREYKQSKNKNK